jgi:flavorubredoxin
VAIQFLEDLVHQPFKRIIVKNGDKLDLGKGHVLEFVNAPNLHWPDTIFSYDAGTQVIFTCDAFGLHYCTDSTF